MAAKPVRRPDADADVEADDGDRETMSVGALRILLQLEVLTSMVQLLLFYVRKKR